MKNVHISLTEFRNESRILKEIHSLSSHGVFEEFYVIALGSSDLPEKELISANAVINRINLRSRRLPKSTPFQLIKFIEFMLKAFLIVRREKASVVNLHTLALLPLGWLIKSLLHIRLVYDAHELETEKNGLQGIRKKISKWVEKIFIASCDLVIVVGDNIADWYANQYNIERPLVVKNAPRLRGKSKNNIFREKFGITENQKIILYQGGLMKGRGVQLILDAFKARTSDNVVVVFMGYGDLEYKVKEAEKKYRNINFLPAVSPNVVLDYTSSADFGIHLIKNTCLNHYYCLPNKFFEYTMAGLPVIVSNMREMADTVTQYGFGAVIEDFSTKSINQAIDALAEQNVEQLSENAYAFASSNAWEEQEKILLSGYQRIVSS